jgi:hypothetical protein
MSKQYDATKIGQQGQSLGGVHTAAGLASRYANTGVGIGVPAGSTAYASDMGPAMFNGATWQSVSGTVAPTNVDATGVSDSTAGLQAWINILTSTGAIGFLPAGTYKITDTLVASGNSIVLQGAGALTTKIVQATSGKTGFRVNITGDGLATPCGYISDISVIGPAANPTDFKSGFLLDTCRGFDLVRCYVSNFDIGYDFINNCFNSAFYSCSTHRFGSCNIGMNLRGIEGAAFQAGNDISIFNPKFFGKLGAVVIGPNSGGYHFFGGQFGSTGLTANRDDLGNIMLGVVYDTVLQTGTGSLTTGSCTVDFNGLSIEGVTRTWFIQCYDEITAGFNNMGYTPSVTGANAALGLIKCTNAKQTQLVFQGGQSIQAGGVFQTAIASFAGGGSALGILEDCLWHQGSLTVNSVGVSALAMQSLGQQSNATSVSIAHARRANLGQIMLGQMWLRGSTSTGGVLQFCVDNAGTTWSAV